MGTKLSMNNINVAIKNNNIIIEGVIQFDNVVYALKKGTEFMQTLNNIKVDLKGLSNSDSSGLALLTALVKVARQQKKEIVFINLPNFMQDISKVYGLDGVLPILWVN